MSERAALARDTVLTQLPLGRESGDGGRGGAWWASPWARFVRQRLIRLCASALVVVIAAFLLIRMIPGDPIRAALGPQASPELVEQLRESNGLNGSLLEQFGAFLSGLFAGRLGTSFTFQLPVVDVIGSRWPVTVALALAGIMVAMILALIGGFSVAVLTRGGRRPLLSRVFVGVTAFFGTVPEFVLAILFIFVFAITLGVLPSAGANGPASFVLPVLALSAGPAAVLSRTLRVEASAVLTEEYVLIARSKHLPGSRLFFRHVLPNALVASMTLGTLLLASAIGGTVLVETVFAMPGLGLTVVTAVLNRDYPLVQGVVMVLGIFVLVAMMLLDLVLARIDPRRLETAVRS